MKAYLQGPYVGKSTQSCNRTFISGPDRQAFYLAIGLIAFPCILFYGFIAPWWVMHFRFGWIIVICSFYLAGVTFSTLILSAYSDPGIIPRGVPKDTIEETIIEREPRRVRINGILFETKYCPTCFIWRPPRSVHCKVCDNCVEKYDHHCPWVGNCIGKRNYRYFYLFVNSATFNLIYGFVLCALQIIILVIQSSEANFSQKVWNSLITYPSPVSLICGVYAFFLVWSIGGLGVFHTYIICKAETTNEDLKGVFRNRKNPFSIGFIKNYLSIVCSPWYGRYIGPEQEFLNTKHFPDNWSGIIKKDSLSDSESQTGDESDETQLLTNVV